MTNRYFNNTLDLIGGTKARASDVEDNFTSVDNGFDAVQAEMDLKAPLANPALTGVPTAPTAPNGTSNFQIATTQFVANQAFTSVLPGQGGQSGKVLSTNGTAASWEVNAPAWGNVTGKPTTLAGYSIDPAAARTELGATTVGNGVFTAANAAAGRTALGASTVGANVFTAADALAARTALGGGLIGQDVFIAATAAAARTAMGVTPANIGAAVAGPLATSGITGAAASGANTDITSLGNIASINGGQLAGLRNLLINGNLAINQRAYVSGTATSGANQYTLDRWRVVTSGQNLAFTASGNGNSMMAPAGGVEQVIEGANIGGGTYVLGWTGTATATVNGTARAKGESFTLTANTNATVRLIGGTASQVQLEPGGTPTPFEHRPIGAELALCQRYFANITGVNALGYAAGGTALIGPVSFKVPMRATPTVANLAGTQINSTGLAVYGPSPDGFGFGVIASATATTGISFGSATASAEL